jgi:hypothetical protein
MGERQATPSRFRRMRFGRNWRRWSAERHAGGFVIFLYCVQSVFTIWMLVDAVRRHSPTYWYIVLFAPFGPLVYFFAVKIDDYDLRWLKRALTFERLPSIPALRHAFRESPSFSNRMKLAGALHDVGEFAEAADLFEGGLDSHWDDAEALYGFARCKIELGEAATALPALAHLFEIKPGYRDFEAAIDYAKALGSDARDEEAIGVLESIVKASPRVPHALYLAEALLQKDEIERARVHLERALGDYEQSPPFVRRRDRHAAGRARDLFARLVPAR